MEVYTMFGGGIVFYTESSWNHFASLSYKYCGVKCVHTHVTGYT